MLHLFVGTDRKAAREAMDAQITTHWRDRERIAVSDASELADLEMSMRGGGLFGSVRVVVLDSVLGNESMRETVLANLSALKTSEDVFFLLEEKVDAATKKQVGKYAESVAVFDEAKVAKNDNSAFGLANALRRGDKKALWVGMMREFAQGKAPEMIHGLLFWAAKQALLSSKQGTREYERAKMLVASLAELPHESRRMGFELEYALERFALSCV